MPKLGSLRYQLIFIFLVLLFSVQNLSAARPQNAKFIWDDNNGIGRQKMVCFRKDFQLKQIPEIAEIHLFADSRYHLIINGVFVNFGPVRSYPENPFFDTYDIKSYLNKGENLITVKVLSNGMNTYQIPKSIGGFIAWGKLGNIDLSTPGNWLCKNVDGLDNTQPKLSFAAGAVESYDARLDEHDFTEIGADLSKWQKPVIITNQNNWAKLNPRIIPHLTQNEILPKLLLGKYQLKDDNDTYSFRVNVPDLTRKQFGHNYRAFAYTYIYSPIDQDVEVGRWWGEFWLNGEGIIKSETDTKIPNRSNSIFKLKKGWNYLFIKYGIVWGCWDFYLTMPKDANLVFSPTKKKDSDGIFMTAGPFLEDEEKVLQLSLPFKNPGDLPLGLSSQWKKQLRGSTAGNPAWNVVWSQFGKKINIHESNVSNLDASFKEGTAFVFDMGGKQLGRIFVEYDAPEGTIIDIGYSEDMIGQKPRVLKRAGLYTGTRFITSQKMSRLETFKPYGLKYLQVNVKTPNGEPATIKRIGVVRQVYPFEKIGSFQCTDPMFNEIWELGWRTLLVCSEDTYTDTPFRERGTYAGDALPEYAITLVTSGDSRLMKQTLEHFSMEFNKLMFPDREQTHFIRSKTGGDLHDFPFLTLEQLRWYVDYTGDIEFAKKLYPGYKYMCDQVIEEWDNNKLIDHRYAFIEWTKINRNATLTTMQSLFARSFENIAYLAEKLGKNKDNKRYQKLASKIRKITKEKCWDNNKKAFRDGFDKGKAIESWYPISSAWPVIFDVTSKDQNIALENHFRETLDDLGDNYSDLLLTPYGGFYVLGALYQIGYADIAEKFIRRYWSPMILRHNDTTWEYFGDNGGQGTLSHAWSGGPTYYFSTEILGVQLGFPEPITYDKVVISPQATENISWAKGKVPHPTGLVEVDWQVKGGKLLLNYKTENNIKCEVKPRGRLGELELWVNGVLRDDVSKEGFWNE